MPLGLQYSGNRVALTKRERRHLDGIIIQSAEDNMQFVLTAGETCAACEYQHGVPRRHAGHR